MCYDNIVGLIGRIPKQRWRCWGKRINTSIGRAAYDKIARMPIDGILKENLMASTTPRDFTAGEFTRNALLIKLIYVNCFMKNVTDPVLNFTAVARFGIRIKFKTIGIRLKISPIIKFIPVQIKIVGPRGGSIGIKRLDTHKIHLVMMDARLRNVAGCDLRSLTFPLLNPTELKSIESDARLVECSTSAGSPLEFDT